MILSRMLVKLSELFSILRAPILVARVDLKTFSKKLRWLQRRVLRIKSGGSEMTNKERFLLNVFYLLLVS